MVAWLLLCAVAGSAQHCLPDHGKSITFLEWLEAPGSWSVQQGAVPPAPCLSVVNATLLQPAVASFGQPDFSSLRPSPVDAGQPLPIYLSNVTFETDCSSVQQYQQYICQTDTMLLAGAVQMTSLYWLYINFWYSDVIVSRHVNITCVPPASNASTPGNTSAPLPPCLSAGVSSAVGLYAALDYLQRTQGAPAAQTRPILIVLEQDVQFTKALVSPYWPFGMAITGNVTLAAVQNDIALDWGGLVNVVSIKPNKEAYLTLSRLVQVNLPAYFAPPVTTRLHIFGVLPSVIWPVNQKNVAPNQFTVKSTINVLAYDSFSLWAYYLSVASSPDPSVSQLAAWTNLRGINANFNVGTNLRIANSVAASVQWTNVTLANPDYRPLMVNNIGLQEITTSSAIVPPTVIFQVASLPDVQVAVNYSINNQWTAQFGLFVVLCANVSGNATSPSMLPVQSDAATETPPNKEDDDFVQSSPLPPAPPPPTPPPPTPPVALNLTLPAVLQAITTFTSWPNASVCWDLQLPQSSVLRHELQTKVTVRQLSLLNLPISPGAKGPTAAPHESLVTGFWMFSVDIGASSVMSSFLALQNVTIYVPPAELQLYFSAASLQQPGAPANALKLSASGRQSMAAWLTKQQVQSSGAHWILFKSLETLRFQGTNVNLTDVVPPACADYAVMPVTANLGAYVSTDTNTLPGWAIGLIVGLGCVILLAVLATILFVRRQRLRNGSRKAAASVAQPKKAPDSLSHVVLAADGSLGSTPTVLQRGCGSDLITSQRLSSSLHNAVEHSDSFSNVFQSTMIDSGNKHESQEPVNPESIFHQLASQNTGLKDEHLQIHGLLGRGGHGVVYHGVWKSLPVAVKVRIVLEEEHEKARSQMLEAMISTSLSHPNIVTTYTYDLKRLQAVSPLVADKAPAKTPQGSGSGTTASLEPFAGATAWQLLIVQELCSGGTIRRLIDRDDLTLERSPHGIHVPHMTHVLQLALDVAQGLEHLHTKNVVHSDLNPDNVLLQVCTTTRAGGLRWTAKVADFGLSETFEAGRSHVSQRFAGTPFYIAPETQSDGIISKQSDIFAFGIMLSELMSGPSAPTAQPGPRRTDPNPHLPPSNTAHALGASTSAPLMGTGAGAGSGTDASPRASPGLSRAGDPVDAPPQQMSSPQVHIECGPTNTPPELGGPGSSSPTGRGGSATHYVQHGSSGPEASSRAAPPTSLPTLSSPFGNTPTVCLPLSEPGPGCLASASGMLAHLTMPLAMGGRDATSTTTTPRKPSKLDGWLRAHAGEVSVICGSPLNTTTTASCTNSSTAATHALLIPPGAPAPSAVTPTRLSATSWAGGSPSAVTALSAKTGSAFGASSYQSPVGGFGSPALATAGSNGASSSLTVRTRTGSSELHRLASSEGIVRSGKSDVVGEMRRTGGTGAASGADSPKRSLTGSNCISSPLAGADAGGAGADGRPRRSLAGGGGRLGEGSVASGPLPSLIQAGSGGSPRGLKGGGGSCSVLTEAGGSSCESPRRLGGEGGKFGSARLLPLLPPTCPLDYERLVAECLDPVCQRRPPIGAVVKRLKALVREHASMEAFPVEVLGSCGNNMFLGTLYE